MPSRPPPARFRLARLLFATAVSFSWLVLAPTARSGEKSSAYRAALESITAERLGQFVTYIADDAFEGREAGSRGGRAIGDYLATCLKTLALQPAGDDGGYFQTFDVNCRNVLGLLPGRDPKLKDQVILVQAHYDHVGYGNPHNSFGPWGYIHNGADDNASGTSAVLKAAEALRSLPEAPKRSILIAFWDGEEKGLLGSKHWCRKPTLPLARVVMVVNVDMVGRLRDNHLIVYGSRTGYGLRRLVSEQNEELALGVDFTWTMKPNGDHYTFFSRGIPVLMLHTGEHENYHRPSDKANLINTAGMQRVGRLLFQTVYELAGRAEVTGFREASRQESPDVERSRFAAPQLPDRLGAQWQTDRSASSVYLTWVLPGSAAEKAGVQAGDYILQFAGRPIHASDDLTGAVETARNPVPFVVWRRGQKDPLKLMATLLGEPLRIGITWFVDDAEPGSVILTHVVPGSPAALAGLAPGDRIYRVAGRAFPDDHQFAELVRTLPGPLEFTIERGGQIRTVVIHFPDQVRRAA